ncbi:hypothetical protein B0H14DRAFT_2658287 [Mycena olivaceomarginata]|nr:hypothetical protein B0H14DRAFT_2658287 [Mycena olivaceomarginata]
MVVWKFDSPSVRASTIAEIKIAKAIAEARTEGLSNFHTTIVLSLSWMNNTNTFIYFLLYVQHKSQGSVKMDLASWSKHLREKLTRREPDEQKTPGESGNGMTIAPSDRRSQEFLNLLFRRGADVNLHALTAWRKAASMATHSKQRRLWGIWIYTESFETGGKYGTALQADLMQI